MESMSGLSRMFINLESERFALDGALILVLDPSTAPGGHDYQRVRIQLAARIPGIAVFTRRAIAAPLAAGHERWVTGPDFSIDRHLKHVGAPAPYDLSALCELTVSLLDEPLDRDRPLWQMFYVDGLADGSAALLFRMHHACIDGVGGMELLDELFDLEPLAADPALSPGRVDGERVPGRAEMLVRSMPDQIVTPVRLAYRGLPVAWALARRLVAPIVTPSKNPRQRDDTAEDSTVHVATGRTPRSLLNRPTDTPKRSLAVASIPMAEIKKAADRFGVTLNDVVLAVTSAAVADYLRDRDDLPGEPLRVASPVNIRGDAAELGGGNYFTMMMVAIPSDITDPVQRLKTISVMTRRTKPARTGADLTRRTASGAVVGGVMRLIDAVPGSAWSGLAHLMNSPVSTAVPTVANYIVSNIPGPRHKLYVAGAEITHVYGRTFVGAGIGLLIHCISYADSLDFGFTTLADLVPDPERIANGIQHHLALLLAAPTDVDEVPTVERRRRPAKTARTDTAIRKPGRR